MATGSSADPNAYYLSAKVKDCEPHFSVQQRNGKNFEEVKTDEWVEGYIKNIVIGTYEYEGAQMPKFTVFLIDSDGTYIVSFTYTIPSRNIINTLLSIENPGLIRFVLSKDKKDYATAFVSNNGKFAGWKYKWEEFERHIIRSPGSHGQSRNNYDNLDKFFEQELKTWIEENRRYFVDVAPQFDIKTSSPSAKTPASTAETSQEGTSTQEESPMTSEEDGSQEEGPAPSDDKTDDLPF